MRLKNSILLLLGAGLLACSSVQTVFVSVNKQIAVTGEYEKENRIDSLISPYRMELDKEMKEVIAHTTKSFERGKPNGVLNNWSTDVILEVSKKFIPKGKPSFCLLNWGGLRNPISEGDVLLEDIYKLMPFDNEIVVVEMPTSSLNKIAEYLISRNGEPIGGAILRNGKIEIEGFDLDNNEVVYIVTSDYLMNGGDDMTFFEDRESEILTGILMRDAMIDAAKEQKELMWNDEKRIILNQ